MRGKIQSMQCQIEQEEAQKTQETGILKFFSFPMFGSF